MQAQAGGMGETPFMLAQGRASICARTQQAWGIARVCVCTCMYVCVHVCVCTCVCVQSLRG